MAPSTNHRRARSAPITGHHSGPAGDAPAMARRLCLPVALLVALVTGLIGATGGVATAATVTRASTPGAATASLPDPPGTITTVGYGLSSNQAITTGPDGNLWVASGARMARVTPTGDVTIFPAPAASDVAPGPDGTVWFTSPSGVGRITPAGVVSLFPGALPGVVINAGPDGNMWTSTPTSINRITPAGVLTTFTDASMTAVADFTFGGDGNVWFPQTGLTTVGRLTPAGVVTQFTHPDNKQLVGITTGTDGTVWTGYLNTYVPPPPAWPVPRLVAGGLVKVAPDGSMTSFAGGQKIIRLATGADGALWSLVDDQGYSSSGNPLLVSEGGIYRFSAAGEATGPWARQARRTLPAGSFSVPESVVRKARDLTAGPDGNMWFIGAGSNSINRVTPDGVVTSFPGNDLNSPAGLALGPTGDLWFANNGSAQGAFIGTDAAIGSIGRRTTNGTVSGFRNTGVANPRSIASGPDGAMWFTDESVSTVGRIDPAGTVTLLQGSGVSRPSEITRGADGNLWFVDGTAKLIGRVTTAGVFTTFPVPGAAKPLDIASGGDGNLWFTTDAHSIGKVTPAGAITMIAPPRPELYLGLITAGPDGNLWFTNDSTHTTGNDIGRLTPAGVFTYFADDDIRTVNGITAGPDGNVWFTNANAASTTSAHPGGIARISPAGVVTWFSSPDVYEANGIVAGANRDLWFTMSGQHTLGHITANAVDAPNQAAFPTATSRPDGAQVTWWPSAPSVGVTGGFITPYRNGVALKPTPFTGAAPSPIVSGLAYGQTYTFTISLTNANGTGPPSPMTAPVTVGKPIAPAFPTATPASGGAVTVSWWSQPVTSGVVTPYLGTVAQTPVPFTGQTSAVTIPGLTAGQTYTFTITVTNPYGTSPASAKTNAVSVAAPPVAAFPAATAGAGGVTVYWWPQPVTGGVITPYLGGVAQTPIPFTGNVSSRLIAGLTIGQDYRFTVTLTNANGTGPPSVQTAPVTVSG